MMVVQDNESPRFDPTLDPKPDRAHLRDELVKHYLLAKDEEAALEGLLEDAREHVATLEKLLLDQQSERSSFGSALNRLDPGVLERLEDEERWDTTCDSDEEGKQ